MRDDQPSPARAASSARPPTILSNSHFITTSQSAIGWSNTSSTGTRADVGIGARAEAQLVGVRREADVDRQHPELLQHLQDAALGRDRQREDHEIDAGAAREFDEIVDACRACGRPAHDGRRAVVAAVVEHADDADVGVALRARARVISASPRLAAADDDGAAVEPALAGPAPHDAEEEQARAVEREQADAVEARRARRANTCRRAWRRTRARRARGTRSTRRR